MNRNMNRIVSAFLAAAVLAGGTGMMVHAQKAETAQAAKTSSSATLLRSEEGKNTKKETVYVLSDAQGTAQKIIVSDWLKNPEGAQTIKDKGDVKDIVNVKGDESYTMDGDSMRVWDAKGNDIYYQGTTEKDLPVTMKVTYQLDGKTVSPEELAGKSGKLKISIEYENHEARQVMVNGSKETVYVPFAMVTGTMLENDSAKNIAVSNGKIINDGNRTIVMGFAMPGLQESLGISKDKIDIPNTVEITAEVEDFSLDTILTFATNDLLNQLNLDKVADASDLSDSLSQLSSASLQLVDGSSALYDGLSTLLEKSDALISGIDQLAAGSKALESGAVTLAGGAQQLQSGMNDLQTGLKTLTGNNKSLTDGAATVFNTMLKTANTQLTAAGLQVPALTIENYQTVLKNVLSSMDAQKVYQLAYNTAKAKVTQAVSAQSATIEGKVKEAVKAQVVTGVLQATGNNMTAEQYAQAIAAGKIPAEKQAAIEAAVALKMNSSEIQQKIKEATAAQINSIVEEKMKSAEVTQQIQAAVASAGSGTDAISQLLNQLNSYNQFYQGLIAYTNGVSSAYEGSGKLSAGVGQLAGGASSLAKGAGTLNSGVAALQQGSNALVDGVGQLKDGAMQLSDGMKKFNEEGIQKLVKAFDGDLKGLTDRLKALVDVSEEYQSFTGVADGMDGSVEFIYRTDSIEAQQDK
ncbi:hypothetical protein [Acidaminobacterium chupaoyuni]